MNTATTEQLMMKIFLILIILIRTYFLIKLIIKKQKEIKAEADIFAANFRQLLSGFTGICVLLYGGWLFININNDHLLFQQFGLASTLLITLDLLIILNYKIINKWWLRIPLNLYQYYPSFSYCFLSVEENGHLAVLITFYWLFHYQFTQAGKALNYLAGLEITWKVTKH